VGTNTSLVNDAYDSIFRTGKIEADPVLGVIKRIKRKVKYHDSNAERQRKREDETEVDIKKDGLKEEL